MPLSSRAFATGATLAAALFALSACGADSWPGHVVEDGAARVGTWKGNLSDLTLECSGDPDESVTLTITAPGDFSAETTQPVGGGLAKVTVTGPERSVTWSTEGIAGTAPNASPDPDDVVQWGAQPTVSSEGGGALDEFQRGDYYFQVDGVLSCEESS